LLQDIPQNQAIQIGGYNLVLMLRKIRRVGSLVLLLISIGLIIWAGLSNPRHSIIQPIIYPETAFQMGTLGIGLAKMEPRQVKIEWPSSMRIGETEEIRLELEPKSSDTGDSNFPNGTPNIYDKYNIMAEARFEVAGLVVNPANPTRESMPAGQTVRYKWKITNDQVGSSSGKVWLSLRLLPLYGGEAIQVPIYIQEINIQTVSLFGLNEAMVLILGGVGIVLSVVLIYTDLIGLVRKWIKRNTHQINTDIQ
jgi:hypothetical protein